MAASGAAARRGTAALFVLTGLLAAAWASRIPDVQHRLHLSPAELAVVLLSLETGAMVGLPVGGALVARLGSRACLRLGFPVFAAGLAGIALVPSLPVLLAVVVPWAAANSVLDVALNTQGAALEERDGRRLLSRLNAGHSCGMLLGAGVTAAAVAAGVELGPHLLALAVVGIVAGALAGRPLVVERAEPRKRAGWPPLDRRVALLGVVALCGFALDGTAYGWSAVQVRTDLDASAVLGAVAYGAFAAALLLGRLTGDRLLEAFGGRRVLQAAGGVAVVATGVLVLSPSVPLTIGAWALLGLATGPIAPTVLGAAARVPGRAPAAAVAATTTIGYLGSFTVPPLVGLLADGHGVAGALVVLLPVAAAVALLASPALRSAAPQGDRPAAGARRR